MNPTATLQPAAVTFPLLAEPDRYQACDLDLTLHAERRIYWINLYRTHFPGLLDEAVAVEVHDGKPEHEAKQRAAAAKDVFFAYLHALEVWHGQAAAPGGFPVEVAPVAPDHGQTAADRGLPVPPVRLDILTMGRRREHILREHGFADPYRLVKERENAAALLALPKLLAELDAMASDTPEAFAQRELVLIQGTFAGNIFDVGAAATLALFKVGKIDFHATRAKLRPRPWRIDHFDRWLHRLATKPAHRAAVLFVDNCGCDIVLGMIPFARALLQRGTRVILAANTTPSLNDITATELATMMDHIATWDRVIAEAKSNDQLQVVASGCGTPLIDLAQVSPQLAEAVTRRGVDLVVLEGMGRAVESNLHVKFTCEVMNLALVKDPDVARHIGGEMYDQVMRFETPVSFETPA